MYENNLKAMRIRRNMTQTEFATELQMNAGVYSRYERGERDLPLSLAKRICIQLDEDMNYLACIDNGIDYEAIAEHKKEVKKKDLAELINNLTKEELTDFLMKKINDE